MQSATRQATRWLVACLVAQWNQRQPPRFASILLIPASFAYFGCLIQLWEVAKVKARFAMVNSISIASCLGSFINTFSLVSVCGVYVHKYVDFCLYAIWLLHINLTYLMCFHIYSHYFHIHIHIRIHIHIQIRGAGVALSELSRNKHSINDFKINFS